MAKLDLDDIEAGCASTGTINANNAKIEAAIDDSLSLSGKSPNQFTADVDMNNQRILNLPAAINDDEPITLAQAGSLATTDTTLTADVIGGYLTPAYVSDNLHPIHADESSAGWVENDLDLQYFYGDFRRYGVTSHATNNQDTDINKILATGFSIIRAQAGTYVVNLLKIQDGQTLIGEGRDNTIFKLDDGAWDLTTEDKTGITYATGATFIGIQDLAYDGNEDNQTQSVSLSSREHGGAGIDLSTRGLLGTDPARTAPSRVRIANAYVYDTVHEGLVSSSTSDIRIEVDNLEIAGANAAPAIDLQTTKRNVVRNLALSGTAEGSYTDAWISASNTRFENVELNSLTANADYTTPSAVFRVDDYASVIGVTMDAHTNLSTLDTFLAVDGGRVLFKDVFLDMDNLIEGVVTGDSFRFVYVSDPTDVSSVSLDTLTWTGASAGAQLLVTASDTDALKNIYLEDIVIESLGSGTAASADSLFYFDSPVQNFSIDNLKAPSNYFSGAFLEITHQSASADTSKHWSIENVDFPITTVEPLEFNISSITLDNNEVYASMSIDYTTNTGTRTVGDVMFGYLADSGKYSNHDGYAAIIVDNGSAVSFNTGIDYAVAAGEVMYFINPFQSIRFENCSFGQWTAAEDTGNALFRNNEFYFKGCKFGNYVSEASGLARITNLQSTQTITHGLPCRPRKFNIVSTDSDLLVSTTYGSAIGAGDSADARRHLMQMTSYASLLTVLFTRDGSGPTTAPMHWYAEI